MGRENFIIEIKYSVSAHHSPRDLTDKAMASQLVEELAAVIGKPQYQTLNVSAEGLTPDFIPQREFVEQLRLTLMNLTVRSEFSSGDVFTRLTLSPEHMDEIIYSAWLAVQNQEETS